MKATERFDFAPLVPDFVLQMLEGKSLRKQSLPLSELNQMGVLFLDVSGFTRFTEFASSKGHYGVENITGLLNRYFELLNCILNKYGGQVVKYGGDSCLSIFPGVKKEVIPVMLACRAEISARLIDFSLEQKRETGVDFYIHGGMSFGNVLTHIVGSKELGLNFFVTGVAIKQAYELDKYAQPGDIVLSPVLQNLALRAETMSDLPCELYPRLRLSLALRRKAELFVPHAVRNKLRDRSSTAELRNAAIIFANVVGNSKSGIIPAEEYQELYTRIQRWVNDFDGTINKIDYSDKGYLIIITFGVPQSHTDLIERAFMCAWRINQIPSRLKLRIGITGCNIYAGIIGAKSCFEYGIIGNGVNIAARLMSFSYPGHISLSEDIIPRIRNRFEVQFIQAAEVKGIQNKINTYRLVRELPENWTAMQQSYSPFPILARQQLIAEMKQLISPQNANPTALPTELPHHIFLLHGPSGSGKSFLIYQICQPWVEQNRPIFYFASDQIASKRRLELFFQVIRRQLGIVSFAAEIHLLTEWAGQNEINIDFSLLTKWLFAKADKDNAVFAEADVQYEHNLFLDTINAILLKLLAGFQLLIFDNLESLDEESMALLQRLIPRIRQNEMKLILCGIPATLAQTFAPHEPYTVSLAALSLAETQALAEFSMPNVAPDATLYIHRLTDGNPLFINELCTALAKQLSNKADLLTVATLKEMEHRQLLPESLENLFIRKYDTLPEQAKSALKTAAIVAKSFIRDELLIYLKLDNEVDILPELESLVAMGFFMIRSLDPQPEYAFANNIMREAIYRTILLSEKKELHRTIALQMAQLQEEALHEKLEAIAEHFIRAEDESNILLWAGKAGDKLLSLADYENSVYYLQAVARAALAEEAVFRAHLSLLEAYIFQGKIAEAGLLLPALQNQHHNYPEQADRFYWLHSRYLNYSAHYEEALLQIPAWLAKVQNPRFYSLLLIDQMDCLLHTADNQIFESEALKAVQALKSNGDEVALGRLAAILGQFYLRQGYYDKALEHYTLRHDLSHKQNDYLGQRISYSALGVIASRSGDKKAAKKYYAKALALAEKHGDRNGYSKVLLDIGILHRNEENYAAALDCYLRVLDLTDITQNKMHYATVLYDIGELYYYKLDYDQALNYFQQSLGVSEAIKDDSGISFCNDAIGDILYRYGRFEEAEATYLRNLEHQIAINDREGIGHTWGNLGNMEKEKGNYDQACEYYYKQVEILTEVGDKDGHGRAWFNLAMIDVNRVMYPPALEKLTIAIALFEECGAEYYIQISKDMESQIKAEMEKSGV